MFLLPKWMMVKPEHVPACNMFPALAKKGPSFYLGEAVSHPISSVAPTLSTWYDPVSSHNDTEDAKRYNRFL